MLGDFLQHGSLAARCSTVIRLVTESDHFVVDNLINVACASFLLSILRRRLSSSSLDQLAVCRSAGQQQQWEGCRLDSMLWGRDPAPHLLLQTPRSGSWFNSSWSSCCTRTNASGGSRPTERYDSATCLTVAPWRTCWTTWLIASLASPARVSLLNYTDG